jgi:hypothetical protein
MLLPSLPQFLLLAAMGVLIYYFWRRSRRQFDRAAERPAEPKPQSESPAELTRWQVEMHELARDLKGEINSKQAVLQILIRHANEAAQRLEAASTRAEKLTRERPLDPLSRIDYWDREEPLADPPSLAPNVASLPERAAIFALADQGEKAPAIARETGLPLGEIELALSLRPTPTRRASEASS